MKVLVTGAAGFIGSHLCSALLHENHTVVGLDSLETFYSQEKKITNISRIGASPEFDMVIGNLLEVDLQSLLRNVDVVFHVAGQPGVRGSWGEGFDPYIDNNIRATQRLLEACRIGCVKRIIYSSSSSVYGEAISFPTDEDVTPQPRSPYGVSKLAAEHLVTLYGKTWDLHTISLRYFTVFGSNQRPDMAIERMIRAARSGAAFKIFGDGLQSRDFTHVSDVVRANLLAAEAEVDSGTVINIAGGSQATVLDLITSIEELVGMPLATRIMDRAPGDVRSTSACTDMARRTLLWTPRMTLDEGLAEQVGAHEFRD